MIVILKRLDVEQHATFRLFELSHYVFSWQVSDNGVLFTKGVREHSNRTWVQLKSGGPVSELLHHLLLRVEDVLANTMAIRIFQLSPQGAWYPKGLQLVAFVVAGHPAISMHLLCSSCSLSRQPGWFQC